eukprot:PhF_6_TR9188/c2_g1_i2/m.14341
MGCGKSTAATTASSTSNTTKGGKYAAPADTSKSNTTTNTQNSSNQSSRQKAAPPPPITTSSSSSTSTNKDAAAANGGAQSTPDQSQQLADGTQQQQTQEQQQPTADSVTTGGGADGSSPPPLQPIPVETAEQRKENRRRKRQMYQEMLSGFTFGCTLQDCELIGNWPLPPTLKAEVLHDYYTSGNKEYGSEVSPYVLLVDGVMAGSPKHQNGPPKLACPPGIKIPTLKIGGFGNLSNPEPKTTTSPQNAGLEPPMKAGFVAPQTLADSARSNVSVASTGSKFTVVAVSNKQSLTEKDKLDKEKLASALNEFSFGSTQNDGGGPPVGGGADGDDMDMEYISSRLSISGNQVKDVLKIVDHRKSLATHANVAVEQMTSVTISKRQSNIHEYHRKKSLPLAMRYDDDSSDDENLDPYAELEKLAAEADL